MLNHKYFFTSVLVACAILFYTTQANSFGIEVKKFIKNNFKGMTQTTAGIASIGLGTLIMWRSKFEHKYFLSIMVGTIFVACGYINCVDGIRKVIKQYSHEKKITEKATNEKIAKIKTQNLNL